jgi:hypothetical protein
MRLINPYLSSGNEISGEIEWDGQTFSIQEIGRMIDHCEDLEMARNIKWMLDVATKGESKNGGMDC